MSSFTQHLYCADCDEKYEVNHTSKRCRVCGSTLQLKQENRGEQTSSSTPAPPNAQLNLLERIASHFSEDLLRAIQDSIAGQAPARSIKESYLKTVGILQVDERNTVIADARLIAGPLRLLCVFASFSYIPAPNTEIAANLVVGNPECGESTFTNSTAIENNLLLLKRGKITFAQKSRIATEQKAKVLLIAQTEGKWPFLMTDNSKELPILDTATGASTSLPVMMLSASDASLLLDYLKSVPDKSITIKFSPPPTVCSICHDNFQLAQDILKLPCRHVYHCECLATWLHSHDTCPLCRYQLSTTAQQQSSGAAGIPASELSNAFMYA
jgi:hypothetical protein